ncbi:hypothetical protein CHARACLAT_016827 [Characodon lateralis]|uniref:Uncharacterized protein n=1 Tax=Characodon lateralis TaxID=208331 RepID=A0ABU7EA95_9TELE|nr:hypothetical protein [Characodon lateralis]
MTRTSAVIMEEVHQAPSLNCASVEKVGVREMEVLTVPAKQKKDILVTNLPDQFNHEAVSHISTAGEKKVVTCQKGQNQRTNLEQTNKVDKKADAENSNVMLVLPLQNENNPEDCRIQPSPRLQRNQLLSWDPGHVTSSLVLKPATRLPGVTYRPTSMQQIQEKASQVPRDQPVCRGGGTLNSTTGRDDGPPTLSSQTPDFIHRSSQMFRKEEPDNTKDFEGTFTDNDDSDTKPVIGFLNEPKDTESVYEPMSTIFECKEEDDGILVPNMILKVEPDLKTKSPTGTDIDIIGNIKNTKYEESLSLSDFQDQNQTDLCMKAQSKRKFKIKFPKNKLAALGQAIRKGTNKRGRKYSDKVIHEEEQNRQQTESKKTSEVNMTKQLFLNSSSEKDITADTRLSKSHARVEDLRKNTLDSISSLEESIKQLELSVDSITTPSDRDQLKGRVKQDIQTTTSERQAIQILQSPNPPQSKRLRSQLPHSSTSKKSSSISAQIPRSNLQRASAEEGTEVLQQPNKNSNIVSPPHANIGRGL